MHRLKKKHFRHIDKKLQFRLKIYFTISVVMLGIVLYEFFSEKVDLPFVLIGLGLGVFIGVVVARVFLVSWHKNARKVISQLDVVGGVILVLYIALSIFRGTIVSHFVQGSQVTGASLALVAGIMIGRVFGTGQQIVNILKEQKLLR